MMNTMIPRGAAALIVVASALLTAPAAHATKCSDGGTGVDGVCCSFNPWANGWVATNPQTNGGPPIYLGGCPGGVRTPLKYNVGRPVS